MNWDSIKETVGKVAPLLGTALGGPAGSLAGGLIAQALGVDERPDAVAQALQTDPDAAIKLRTVESNNATELRRCMIEAETTRLAEINKTMRAELAADGWFRTGWRPLIGYVVALGIGSVLAGIAYALFKEPAKAPELVENAIMVIVSAAAILGVNIRERSKDKANMLGQGRTGVLQAVVDRIKK